MRASYAQGTLLDLLRDLVKTDTQNPDFSGFAGSEGLPPLPTPLESFGGAREKTVDFIYFLSPQHTPLKKSTRVCFAGHARARVGSTLVLP